MKSKKSTGELLHEIATTKQDFESFANENKDEFDEFDSRDYLNRLLNTKNLQPRILSGGVVWNALMCTIF